MRQRMMLLAATLVGSLFASTASAQAPLQTTAASRMSVQLVRGCSGSGAPATPIVVQGCGGSCASDANCARPHLLIGAGTVSPVGCSCLASDKTFMFGSCRQFFNPQNVCGRGCIAGCRTPCSLPIYGPGIGQPANNCEGPYTYLFR